MFNSDRNHYQHIAKTLSFLGLCNGQSRKRPTDRGGKNIFAFLCRSLCIPLCTMQVMGVTLKPDIEVSNTGLKKGTNPNECLFSISKPLTQMRALSPCQNVSRSDLRRSDSWEGCLTRNSSKSWKNVFFTFQVLFPFNKLSFYIRLMRIFCFLISASNFRLVLLVGQN